MSLGGVGSSLFTFDGSGLTAVPGEIVTPLPLRSLRNTEKAGDERSILVKSVSRVFSAINSSFLAFKSSASVVLAAISPSSCPIYSINH